MPRNLISDAHKWMNEIPYTIWRNYTAKGTVDILNRFILPYLLFWENSANGRSGNGDDIE